MAQPLGDLPENLQGDAAAALHAFLNPPPPHPKCHFDLGKHVDLNQQSISTVSAVSAPEIGLASSRLCVQRDAMFPPHPLWNLLCAEVGESTSSEPLSPEGVDHVALCPSVLSPRHCTCLALPSISISMAFNPGLQHPQVTLMSHTC